MRKRKKLVIAVKCDYCGTETESFICDEKGLKVLQNTNSRLSTR
jgi:hypothetical protein